MLKDHHTKDGALKLASRIEVYWRRRGYDVKTELFEHGFNPLMRAQWYSVRSDMINGLPRGMVCDA